MTFSVSSLYQWPRHSTSKAREMVLGIIKLSKTPLATKDIYKVVKPARANADEEIRSMRYLKTVVLRDLAAHNHIEKVRMRGAFTAWLWRPKQAPSPSLANQSKPSPNLLSQISSSTAPTPAAVGVGEDWSHLNKRRQRARKMKVEKDLQRMLEVQKVRGEAELQS